MIRLHPVTRVLLPLACWSATGMTQETAPELTSASGMALSMAYQQRRDDVLNPLRHSGSGVVLSVVRDRPHDARSTRFEFELTANLLASRYDPESESVAAGVRLAFRRVGRVSAPPGGLSTWLGAQLEGATEFAYFTNWDDSHFYWRTSYAVGFAGAVERAWSPRRSWLLEWNLPLVALVSRPEAEILYKTDNPAPGWVWNRLHDHLRLTSIHEHRAVDLTLRYVRKEARFARNVFLRSQYARTDLPDSRPLTTIRLSLGATLGWGRADVGSR